MDQIKNFLSRLTHQPGVYQMLDVNGAVIYVGKAKDLKKRVSSYFSNKQKDPKTNALVKLIADIHITVTRSENEAVLLECNLIKQHRPRYNVLLRDDKSYPYIYISTEHPFPRVDIYRGARKKQGRYFGPYPNSLAVRETINHLQKIFRIRTCRDTYFAARSRPCLLYQIGRCTAPCVDYVTQDDYVQQVHLAILFLEGKSDELINELQLKMEAAAKLQDYELAAYYRDQVARLRQIQDKQYIDVGSAEADILGFAIQSGVVCVQWLTIRHGQIQGSRSYFPNVPLSTADQEVISAFITQHYFSHPASIEFIPKNIIIPLPLSDQLLLEQVLTEQAGRHIKLISNVRGEKRKWLDMAQNTAKQSLAAHLYNKINYNERLQALQDYLELDSLPKRIECYDISHTRGEATVASCVVFDQNGPLKSDYRRFNIQDITPGDDLAAMRQVLLRRFKNAKLTLPEVVLIDGGSNQLLAAESVIDELQLNNIFLVGVAKGPERKAGHETLHTLHKPPRHLPADSLALHLIQQIRDEAHRFAITSHRARRAKSSQQSSLETIEGIGAKRRRDLLRYFGGIQGVAHASLEEIMKVPGISRSLAERIFATFHDTTI